VVRGVGGLDSVADLVLVAAGVTPNAQVAAAAGVETGKRSAIRVDRSMRTNVADVFAAGDCVETWHHMLQSATYLPLGTTAHKQGRVAGENAVGGHRLFDGSLATQVVKVFDIAIARTGLRDHEARRAGFDPLTVQSEAWDHKAYYPGAEQLRICVTGDRRSGRLLGAQMLGDWQSEVAKRIDVYAAASTTATASSTASGVTASSSRGCLARRQHQGYQKSDSGSRILPTAESAPPHRRCRGDAGAGCLATPNSRNVTGAETAVAQPDRCVVRWLQKAVELWVSGRVSGLCCAASRLRAARCAVP
jgi:hypothetical protein